MHLHVTATSRPMERGPALPSAPGGTCPSRVNTALVQQISKEHFQTRAAADDNIPVSYTHLTLPTNREV